MTADTPKPALPEPEDDDVAPPKVTGSPERIWLVYGEIEQDDTHDNLTRTGEVSWCEDQQFDSDVEYVRAGLTLAAVNAAVAEVRAVPEDFLTHRDSWRQALSLLAASDSGGYWQHELRAFDAAYDALSATPSPTPTARVALSDEQIGRLIERHAGGCEWSDADAASAEKFARSAIAEYERLNGITPQEPTP